MTDEKTARFLPFHALNEFMRNDYRLAVVRKTLLGLPALPEHLRRPVESLTRKLVKVPGFRHSDKAPARVRVVPTADAFEKSPELVAAILAAWAELHPVLRQRVFDLLEARGWQLLPLELERAKLPGFGINWPKGEDFETLVKAYRERYPEGQAEAAVGTMAGSATSAVPAGGGDTVSNDDICLMVVWVAARLPYPAAEEGEAPGDQG